MLRVTLGSHNRCDYNRHEWSSFVSWARSPTLSSFAMFGQDISLLRLDRPAPINQYISPICLPEIPGTSRCCKNWCHHNNMHFYNNNQTNFRVTLQYVCGCNWNCGRLGRYAWIGDWRFNVHSTRCKYADSKQFRMFQKHPTQKHLRISDDRLLDVRRISRGRI